MDDGSAQKKNLCLVHSFVRRHGRIILERRTAITLKETVLEPKWIILSIMKFFHHPPPNIFPSNVYRMIFESRQNGIWSKSNQQIVSRDWRRRSAWSRPSVHVRRKFPVEKQEITAKLDWAIFSTSCIVARLILC